MTRETFWNDRYSDEVFHFGEEPNAFLAREAYRLKPGQRALAIADGEGRNGVFLASRGLLVDAIDASSVGQQKALRLAERQGVTISFEVIDIEDYRWSPETYDLVLGIFFQFAGPILRDEIFAGIQRTLKPGGLLLIEGYRPEQLGYGTGGPDIVENLYTEEILRRAFSRLDIVSLHSYDAAIHEGRGHEGMSALIDLVARKPAA